MNFEKEFESWLQKALRSDVPGSVEAFSFNLYEPGPLALLVGTVFIPPVGWLAASACFLPAFIISRQHVYALNVPAQTE